MDGEAKFDRLAGSVLILSALGVVLMMAHHPSHIRSGGIGSFVHGAMILLIALVTYGLAHLSVRQGLGRPSSLGGLIAWGIAAFANVGAAMINGFAVPALAGHADAGPGAFALAWELNQALARLGVIATGAAFLIWSCGWLVRPGGWGRVVGVMGLACGIAPVALLLSDSLSMHVAGAMTVYAMHMAWIFAVGLYLWTGRFEAERALSASRGM